MIQQEIQMKSVRWYQCQPYLTAAHQPIERKIKFRKNETHSSSPHLGVDILEVGVLFIYLEIEFGGGDRESALCYHRGGHKLSWCAQANRTCQKEKTSHTSWNNIFQNIK